MGGSGQQPTSALQAEQDRKRLAEAMANSFKEIGAGTASGMQTQFKPYQTQNLPQALGQGGTPIGAGGQALGPLFPGGQALGSTGINEQQLAALLKALGYA